MNRVQGIRGPQFYYAEPFVRSEADMDREEVPYPVWAQMHMKPATPRNQWQRRTFYCGAYWGMGGHEDGFRSGIDAAERLLDKLPEFTRRPGPTNESDYSADMGNADQRQGG